jgi:hypothetical protein
MKYMVQGGFHRHPLMRLTLGLTLLLLLGFWATNAALYLDKMDLRPASVVRYYLGSEEDFTPPRSYGSMLEVTHGHLAMMAMVLLFLTHLVIFVPAPRGAKIGFIVLTFLSALGGEAASWLVRFVSPAFAPLKVGCFVALQSCLALLILALGAFLLREALAERRASKRLTPPEPRSRLRRKRKQALDLEQEERSWPRSDASQSTREAETPPV